MEIDPVSRNLIKVALSLDSKTPGLVSEIWLDENSVNLLKEQLPADSGIDDLLKATANQIRAITDPRRKKYLEEILHSLRYQLSKPKSSYFNFTQNVFGYAIGRVTELEIKFIEDKIRVLEKEIGLSREELYQKYSLNKDNYQQSFANSVAKVKPLIPKYILEFPDSGFIFDTAISKPWGAFNSHIAPYKSKLTVNLDSSFTQLDLFRLASHESYGGHHSELSNKDNLLLNEGRGEHGLVITFSPQTFVSEAIAEGTFTILNILEKNDPNEMMAWYYDRLIFALYNLATFLFFEDKLSKESISEQLKKYYISDKTREGILGFSTDSIYGRYAPVYYTAYNFIENLFLKAKDKEKLIKTLFTQPCTPNLLTEEFSA